jgi:hypothetical protein
VVKSFSLSPGASSNLAVVLYNHFSAPLCA